ncbi:hypothetical protein SPBR_02322 [Sporothrix brasiliensis 5110]|uniref:Uncharacterized protein n=1 Tax=Sporothrix brasiliensis 5110 TaxID=1398154 RepID=A0A0C2F2R4_9PEZI|nr:uncharacterized protein SPBR_02322 [Sporothrix brasiliensis 5110]KIH93159.1 hypothetical protein SPBR_02322 [Sporothrix brasiliensis 5110]
MSSNRFGHFAASSSSRGSPSTSSGGRQIAERLMLHSFSLAEMDGSGHFIATALNIALELLESAAGQNVLRDLGTSVVRAWRATGSEGSDPFDGDEAYMSSYVRYFVQQMRLYVPWVTIDPGITSLDVIAHIETYSSVESQLDAFIPRASCHFSINPLIVESMLVNDTRLWQPTVRGASSAEEDRLKRKAKHNYDTFLFIFGVAFFHESCHAFTTYLAGSDASSTPPAVTYLTYHETQSEDDDEGARNATGESGRWAERQLLGGSLELYRDVDDDNVQPGVPFLLDDAATAWPVKSDAIHAFISNVQHCRFPLRTGKDKLTEQDRITYGIASLGSTDTVPAQASHRTMAALRQVGQLPAYNIMTRLAVVSVVATLSSCGPGVYGGSGFSVTDTVTITAVGLPAAAGSVVGGRVLTMVVEGGPGAGAVDVGGADGSSSLTGSVYGPQTAPAVKTPVPHPAGTVPPAPMPAVSQGGPRKGGRKGRPGTAAMAGGIVAATAVGLASTGVPVSVTVTPEWGEPAALYAGVAAAAAAQRSSSCCGLYSTSARGLAQTEPNTDSKAAATAAVE